MKKKSKNNNNIENGVNIVIAVLILEVVGLIIALFLVLNWNMTLNLNNIPIETTDTTKKYTYESIKGLYKENNVVNPENKSETTLVSIERYLLLNDDGTFYYKL